MWAIKHPDWAADYIGFGETKTESWGNAEVLSGYRKSMLKNDGYRCIRVKVVEVES